MITFNNKKKIISIGSLNPSKIKAIKKTFLMVDRNFQFISYKVNSGVPDQPIGINIIVQGAINRAKKALNYSLEDKINREDLHLGIGIEAGLAKIEQSNSGYMDFQFCAIIDENDYLTLGSGMAFEYPKHVIKQVINEGKEIGEIMAQISGNSNIKNQLGAIGFLSKGLLKREDILSKAVICALIPRINNDMFFND